MVIYDVKAKKYVTILSNASRNSYQISNYQIVEENNMSNEREEFNPLKDYVDIKFDDKLFFKSKSGDSEIEMEF